MRVGGDTGTGSLLLLIQEGQGSAPAPPHTSRRLLARSRRASSAGEGKRTSKGLPKPPALSRRGPRVRDHAEFRAKAEPGAMGLAAGEDTVLPSPPAASACGSPSSHGCSPLDIPPNPRWCSPCGCCLGNLLSNNEQERTLTGAQDRRGSVQPYLEALRSSAGGGAVRGGLRAHSSGQLSCRGGLHPVPLRAGASAPGSSRRCTLTFSN